MPDEPKGNESQNAPAPPAAKTPSTEELLAQNSTPEGRARTAAMFGVVNTEQTGNNVIDVFDGDPEGKALHGDMVKHFGGEQGFVVASADFTEAIELLDPEREFAEAVEKMTPAEEAQAVKEVVASYREALATPEKAQALLTAIYAHPDQEPGISYFERRASPAVNNAFAKLWQAAYGEKPVGLPPRQGDGFVR